MVRFIFISGAVLSEFIGACFGQLAPVSVETPYNHITIERIGSIVEMRSFWRSKVYRESAVDLNDGSRLIVPYTAFIGASAIFHPSPKSALMIGLGGGGFNQFFEKAFPSATLESIELDSQVLALAQKIPKHLAAVINHKTVNLLASIRVSQGETARRASTEHRSTPEVTAPGGQ